MATEFSPSGLTYFVFVVVFTFICGAILVLRLWALKISGRKVYWDDGFVLLAYVNAVALGGVGLWAALNGLGKSEAVLDEYQIGASAKLLFTAYICWLLSSVFVKLSILTLYNRIFTTPQFKRWSYGLFATVVCYCIGYFCVYMTNCEPIDYMWNPTPGGHCRDGQISDYSTVSINLFLDLAILVLPMPTLWSLQLATRKKVVITVMFSFGLATIAVMIWRLIETAKYRSSPDFTSYLGLIALISMLELWLGIIVACIPTLAPLLRLFITPMINKFSHKSRSAGSQPRLTPIQLRILNKQDNSHYNRMTESREAIHNPGQGSDPSSVAQSSVITTDCAFVPAEKPMTEQLGDTAIHVRHDLESQIYVGRTKRTAQENSPGEKYSS